MSKKDRNKLDFQLERTPPHAQGRADSGYVPKSTGTRELLALMGMANASGGRVARKAE